MHQIAPGYDFEMELLDSTRLDPPRGGGALARRHREQGIDVSENEAETLFKGQPASA